MADRSHKGGGSGNKKHGRNKIKCERYRMEGRREKNKALRFERQERRREKRELRQFV